MNKYAHVIVHTSALGDTLWNINRNKHKIIAVTQHGNAYTIFYEISGNKKEDTNG